MSIYLTIYPVVPCVEAAAAGAASHDAGAAGGTDRKRPAHIVLHAPEGWDEVEWQRVLQAQMLERVAAARHLQVRVNPIDLDRDR